MASAVKKAQEKGFPFPVLFIIGGTSQQKSALPAAAVRKPGSLSSNDISCRFQREQRLMSMEITTMPTTIQKPIPWDGFPIPRSLARDWVGSPESSGATVTF